MVHSRSTRKELKQFKNTQKNKKRKKNVNINIRTHAQRIHIIYLVYKFNNVLALALVS